MQDPDFAEIVGLICKEDPRFDRKAYDFIRLGLDHAVKELKKKDLGISTVVSGLCGETEKICAEIGLTPHTVNFSLGIHGKTEEIPQGEVLEIHTLCGHAMVAFGLIEHMVQQIDRGKITCKAAAKKLSRMCDCGIFNTYRAEKLLERMTPDRPR